MTFIQLVQQRSSVRDYLPHPVPRDKIERCLEAARLAPSACNSQPWYFIVIDNCDLRDEIARKTLLPLTSMNRFALHAPVIVALIAKRSKMTARLGGWLKKKKFNWIDVGIAAEHFCLQATEEGLGTCMLGWFDETAVKKILQVPKAERVILLITVGYYQDKGRKEKRRKPLQGIFRYNLAL
jgi:nitroreductase